MVTLANVGSLMLASFANAGDDGAVSLAGPVAGGLGSKLFVRVLLHGHRIDLHRRQGPDVAWFEYGPGSVTAALTMCLLAFSAR